MQHLKRPTDSVRAEHFYQGSWQSCTHEFNPSDDSYVISNNMHPPNGWRGEENDVRFVMHFNPPIPLSSLRVASRPCKPKTVQLFSIGDGCLQRQLTYAQLKSDSEGGVVVDVQEKDDVLWDKIFLEFVVDGNHRVCVKPAIYVKQDEAMPPLHECMPARDDDFVFICNDGVEVRMGSLWVMTACQFFHRDRSNFGDAQKKQLSLVGKEGFASPVVLAVKEILTKRVFKRSMLIDDCHGLEVVRLLYFLGVVGIENVWKVFCNALPSLSVEQFKAIVDLAGEYGEMETLLAFSQFAVHHSRKPVVDHVTAVLTTHFDKFTVDDPAQFVASLRVKK